jgi:site-specific DNA recombinase
MRDISSRAAVRTDEDRDSFLRKNGFSKIVAHYHDEAVSGASMRGRAGMVQLLADARAGRFDILCAEALDRISRDQEDIAHVDKLLRFNGITLHTVAEGLTNEMHIGLKGAMNDLFLKDLADKTRRGLRGRVEKGQSGGGLAYGYDVVSGPDATAGGRSINEGQAIIVRRIFSAFAEGRTPGAIADVLNRECIPGPAGRLWAATTIRGHRARGTGLLNNEIYRGILVWNRQHFVKNPETGKRQARMNPEALWVRKEVPALRIIDETLWQAAKARQSAQDEQYTRLRDGVRKGRELRARKQVPASSNFCRMLICEACNADFVPVGRDRYGCAGHYRRKGCGNGKTLPRRVMDEGVIELLAEAAIALGKLKATSDIADDRQVHSRVEVNRRELDAVESRLGGLLAAIEDGLYSRRMKTRFQQLEDQADRLRATLKIDCDRLQSLTVRADHASEKAVAAMVTELRATDDEYVIVKLRRMLGPIKVIPGLRRAQCTLQWDQEPKLSHATG